MSIGKLLKHMHLVIVESPGKAKTINQYLGKDYIVLACFGHIYDLPKKKAIDVEHNFEQSFQLITKHKKHLDAIIAAAKKSDTIYLATDPDREGEAIAWHLEEFLHEHKMLKKKHITRVTFNQITPHAILEAINNPRDIYKELVDAQKARRGLDYLVGFNLSPLLWRKVRPGLSAGRVQSPALRMIAEREQEIRAFETVEYWDIWAQFPSNLEAKLTMHAGEKLASQAVSNEQDAQTIRNSYVLHPHLEVIDIQRREKKRKPYPPFQTSTLQQESSKQLGFSTTRTMSIAQSLYEGIEVNGQNQALITYMRTDSITIAQEAVDDIRDHIMKHFGERMLPNAPRLYKSNKKNTQEAHEAIRPIDINLSPDKISKLLNKDALKLYDLIWRRTLASQMCDALMESQTILFSSHQNDTWKLPGTRITFDGFLRIFKGLEDNEDTVLLPQATIGDTWNVKEYLSKQHFTEPPARYSEASLVKALEEYGIGRPSTYATIPATLIKRAYVQLDKKRFHPTPTGEVVNQFLVDYFTQYVDYAFTAALEESLDDIAQGQNSYTTVMEQFWHPFITKIETIQTEVSRHDVTSTPIEEQCPECDKSLVIKLGRAGKFIACSGFPECKYTRALQDDGIPEADHPCPTCHKPLMKRQGRYGPFYGCTGYPDCKHIESIIPTEQAFGAIACPECHKGLMVAKKSRFNKIFYACNQYPTCKYALWNPPHDSACTACQWPIVTLKTTKRYGEQIVCPHCNHTTPHDPSSSSATTS